jgi:hypothetical protein
MPKGCHGVCNTLQCNHGVRLWCSMRAPRPSFGSEDSGLRVSIHRATSNSRKIGHRNIMLCCGRGCSDEPDISVDERTILISNYVSFASFGRHCSVRLAYNIIITCDAGLEITTVRAPAALHRPWKFRLLIDSRGTRLQHCYSTCSSKMPS